MPVPSCWLLLEYYDFVEHVLFAVLRRYCSTSSHFFDEETFSFCSFVMEYEGSSSYSSNLTLSEELLIKCLKKIIEVMELKNYVEAVKEKIEEIYLEGMRRFLKFLKVRETT